MKRTIALSIILFWLVAPLLQAHAVNGAPTEKNFVRQGPPLDFNDVVKAHGGERVLLADSIQAAVTRLTPKEAPLSFVERRLVIATCASSLRVDSVDPGSLIHRIEVIDGRTGYSGLWYSPGDPTGARHALPADESRSSALRWSVEIACLPTLLRRLARSSFAPQWVGRSTRGWDAFVVGESGRDWQIAADEHHLIRQVATGDLVLDFSDVRDVGGGMTLPYIENVYLEGRLVYTLFFSQITVSLVCDSMTSASHR
jgi:hypothetical protein